MVNLTDELKYLQSIEIDRNFEETTCNKIKDYVSKVISCQSISEIHIVYKEIDQLKDIEFPRLAYNLEHNIEDDLETLKIKFVVSSIDKILNSRYQYN